MGEQVRHSRWREQRGQKSGGKNQCGGRWLRGRGQWAGAGVHPPQTAEGPGLQATGHRECYAQERPTKCTLGPVGAGLEAERPARRRPTGKSKARCRRRSSLSSSKASEGSKLEPCGFVSHETDSIFLNAPFSRPSSRGVFPTNKVRWL